MLKIFEVGWILEYTVVLLIDSRIYNESLPIDEDRRSILGKV